MKCVTWESWSPSLRSGFPAPTVRNHDKSHMRCPMESTVHAGWHTGRAQVHQTASIHHLYGIHSGWSFTQQWQTRPLWLWFSWSVYINLILASVHDRVDVSSFVAGLRVVGSPTGHSKRDISGMNHQELVRATHFLNFTKRRNIEYGLIIRNMKITFISFCVLIFL